MLQQKMKNSEVLHRTADVVEEYGYGFGSESFIGERGVCIDGALHLTLTGTLPTTELLSEGERHLYSAIETTPAGKALTRYINGRGGYHSSLYSWNDRKMLEYQPSGIQNLHDDTDPRVQEAKAQAQQAVVEALRACALIEEAKEDGTYVEPEVEETNIGQVYSAMGFQEITFDLAVSCQGMKITFDKDQEVQFTEAVSGDDLFQTMPNLKGLSITVAQNEMATV
jgi:hypothetical protein